MELRENKGFHPMLDYDHPYVFVDSCMQIWPDADLSVAHRHGVTAYAVTSMRPHASLEGALEDLMYWHLVARERDNLSVVTQADDIRRAKEESRAGLLLAAQGADFVGQQLHRLEAFYRLGLRMLLPSYNSSNAICGGCLDRTNGGLTRFGELVVQECNRIGLLLDCTHISERASLDIIERSVDPVVFSHSNPKSLVDNPRNITDEAIGACAQKGGVVGLVVWGPLVLKTGTTTWPTVDDFIDLVDHVAQILGSVDNIGLSTDMSLGTYPMHKRDPWGEPQYPGVATEYGKHVTSRVLSPKRNLDGFCSYPEVVNLIDRLLERGYEEADVAKILGENYLRVFEQVWKPA
jgi:membrane dipeptidase